MEIKLYDHQVESKNFIINNGGSGALFLDAGLGKTITAIEIFKQLPVKKLLVICPLTLVNNAWVSEIKKFTTFTFQDLHKDKVIKNVDIYLINYESFISRTKFAMIEKLANSQKMMCVIDESSRMKTYNSMTTKALLSLRDAFPYKVLCSGTPAPNSPLEFHAQMRFISDIFHPSFFVFRNMYFHLSRGKQVMEVPRGSFVSREMAAKIFSQGWKYAITEARKKSMFELMAKHCIWKKKEDCLNLPPQVDIIRKVELCPDQSKAYKEMKTELITELKGQVIVAQMVLTRLGKLRQICGGILIGIEGTETFDKNAKLDELQEIVDEIGDHQIIIWCFYQHEAVIIKQLLGDKSEIVNGTVDQDAKNESIRKFKNNEVQYLICNPASIAHGVTLTNCSYAIYYSLSYSAELYSQSKDRIHRIGTKSACTYYHIIAENTVDEIILDVLKNKLNQEEVAYRFINERK